MAGVQRRGLQLNHHEENVIGKNVKNFTANSRGTRTALSNISNIQRRPNLGVNKLKKDDVSTKILGRAKGQSNLQKAQPHIAKETATETALSILSESNHNNTAHMEDLESEESEDLFFHVEDIDEEDGDSPALCAEYVKDIYKYMHKLEERLIPGDYMQKQTEINKKMRSILIDWLIQVQSRFNLLQETLFLTVYIIDRFLEKSDVNRTELQLVGVTAMLIASKYEEMYAPEIGDFVYITDNAYSKTKIRSMEQKMLNVCDYDFSNPLCLHFLRRNSKAGSVDAKKHSLAKYFMELTLVDYTFTGVLPSQIAAAALFLSIKLIDNSEWTPTLAHYSGYSESAILPVVSDMAALVFSMETSKYQAVKTKYSASKFLRVSRLPELKGNLIQSYAAMCQK